MVKLKWKTTEFFDLEATDEAGAPVTGAAGMVTVTDINGVAVVTDDGLVELPGGGGIYRYNVASTLLPRPLENYLAVVDIVKGSFSAHIEVDCYAEIDAA